MSAGKIDSIVVFNLHLLLSLIIIHILWDFLRVPFFWLFFITFFSVQSPLELLRDHTFHGSEPTRSTRVEPFSEAAYSHSLSSAIFLFLPLFTRLSWQPLNCTAPHSYLVTCRALRFSPRVRSSIRRLSSRLPWLCRPLSASPGSTETKWLSAALIVYTHTDWFFPPPKFLGCLILPPFSRAFQVDDAAGSFQSSCCSYKTARIFWHSE